MTEKRKLNARQGGVEVLLVILSVTAFRFWQTLLELVDYVNSAKQPFAEHIMPEVVNMV